LVQVSRGIHEVRSMYAQRRSELEENLEEGDWLD